MKVSKYEMQRVPDGTWVDIPIEARFLHAAVIETGFVNMWFEVYDEEPLTPRLFYIVATGQVMPASGGYQWLATILEPGRVWHIYERTNL